RASAGRHNPDRGPRYAFPLKPYTVIIYPYGTGTPTITLRHKITVTKRAAASRVHGRERVSAPFFCAPIRCGTRADTRARPISKTRPDPCLLQREPRTQTGAHVMPSR